MWYDPVTCPFGYLRICIGFGVVENLAVLILIGTLYIDRSIEGIFPTEGTIVSVYSAAAAILPALASAIKSFSAVHVAENKPQLLHTSATIFEVKQFVIPLNTEMTIPV